jgi:hypothetical protein
MAFRLPWSRVSGLWTSTGLVPLMKFVPWRLLEHLLWVNLAPIHSTNTVLTLALKIKTLISHTLIDTASMHTWPG